MGDLKWPSFTIQGIILAINVPFLLRDESNIWLILSVFFILVLFSLQATSVRWIYLFPGRDGEDTPDIDTQILRIFIMLASMFLFVGIYEASKLSLGISWVILSVVIFLVITLTFNFWLNSKIKKKIEKKV